MRHLMRRSAARGLTLIELMIGLAITAMLLVAAGPFYGDYVANSRLREGGNALFAETMFAQSEAIKRNVRVQVSVAGASVETRDMNASAAGDVIRTITLPAPVQAASAATFSFGSDGRPTPFGTSVSVDIVASGQTCSSDRRCPGLRVDAGGAVRLCGDHQVSCP